MSSHLNSEPSSGSSSQPRGSSVRLMTILILVGLIGGVLTGEGLRAIYGGQVPEAWLGSLSFVGDAFFMSLLKMVLVPLVFASVVSGVSSIGSLGELGRMGGLTLFYYITTMLIAVILGVILISCFHPGDPAGDGRGIGVEHRQGGESAYAEKNLSGNLPEDSKEVSSSGWVGAVGLTFQRVVRQIIPANPLKAAVEGQLLPVIAFALIMGIGLTAMGPAARPLTDLIESILTLMMWIISWVLWLAPLGVFTLVAWSVATVGFSSLAGPVGGYFLVVLLGLALHGFVVLPLILRIFGKTNPYRFMHQMREALMMAFGTDSSSATLPVTIESAVREGGCSPRTANFVLPLGATINMDGTALYEAVAVVFLFQCYGIQLETVQLAIVVLTATLAAIGTAGIPSAGLITMVIVVEAVNHSLGGITRLPLEAVGIILGVDRFLDMSRTTVNVWGDAVGAKILTRLETLKQE